MEKIKFLDLNISFSDKNTFLKSFRKLLEKPGFHTIVTLNPQIYMGSKKNTLKNYLTSADFILPDGIGIAWAIKVLSGKKIPKMPGIELVEHLLSQEKHSFYCLGNKEKTLNEFIRKINTLYPKTKIIGAHHGYFSLEDEEVIIKTIQKNKPDIILVGLGFPKQEEFLLKLSKNLDHGVGIGIGGSFDVLSGNKKRAPLWMQKLGLEWFYRILKEPMRIFRLYYIPGFILKIFCEKILSCSSNYKNLTCFFTFLFSNFILTNYVINMF